MSLETLKKVRLYFPGTLGVILAAVYYFGADISSIKDLFLNGSAISLGLSTESRTDFIRYGIS